MAHIMGMSFVSAGRVFALDEGGSNFGTSDPINAITAALPVGRITAPDFRVYVGTSDGNIALFRGQVNNPPQIVHVTDAPVFWSLYHAGRTLYLGTGDLQGDGPFTLMALNDETMATLWEVWATGPLMYPASVAYEGTTPRQVIFTNGNPSPAVRALDVASGTDLWSVPEDAFGQKVHEGVVYYANLADSTLRARKATDGSLLWSFTNPRNFNFNVPFIAGGVVWASTVGNQLFALRASDGSVLWEASLGGHPGVPVVTFDHRNGLSLVAVAEQNNAGPGFLRGFDANTGAALWTSSVPVSETGESCTDPIIIPHFEGGLQVQIGTFDGRLMTFNAYTGQLAWEKAITPGSALLVRPHWEGW